MGLEGVGDTGVEVYRGEGGAQFRDVRVQVLRRDAERGGDAPDVLHRFRVVDEPRLEVDEDVRHRDTWYAAPPQQLNWWMPVWPAAENNAMEFYPRYFGKARENNSGDYNYYDANVWRGRIKDFSGGKDTRLHPAPVAPLDTNEPTMRVLPPVGGIMIFSGDQLHATTRNTSPVTRYSIDFRTVHAGDVRDGTGAPARTSRAMAPPSATSGGSPTARSSARATSPGTTRRRPMPRALLSLLRHSPDRHEETAIGKSR